MKLDADPERVQQYLQLSFTFPLAKSTQVYSMDSRFASYCVLCDAELSVSWLAKRQHRS